MSRRLLYMHVLHTCTGDKPKSWTKEQDRTIDYSRHLLHRWNNDPDAIASRERSHLGQEDRGEFGSRKGILDPAILKKIKKAVVAGIEADFDLDDPKDAGEKRWKKLIITRTAAKLTEYIGSALLGELYPKSGKQK